MNGATIGLLSFAWARGKPAEQTEPLRFQSGGESPAVCFGLYVAAGSGEAYE